MGLVPASFVSSGLGTANGNGNYVFGHVPAARGRAAGRVGNDTTVSNAAKPLADSVPPGASSFMALPFAFPPARVFALRARIPHATARNG